MRPKLASLLAAASIALSAGFAASPSEAGFWARGVDWGAIYYDHRTGRGAWVYGYNSEADARRAAQREAERRGINHTRWFTVEGGCLSIFKDRSSSRYGWGRSGDRGPARATARRYCQDGGYACEERVWVCTSR
jgi:hypothetical protein